MSARNTSPHPERYKIRVALLSGKSYEAKYRYGARDRAESAARSMQTGPAVSVLVLDSLHKDAIAMEWRRDKIGAPWRRVR